MEENNAPKKLFAMPILVVLIIIAIIAGVVMMKKSEPINTPDGVNSAMPVATGAGETPVPEMVVTEQTPAPVTSATKFITVTGTKFAFSPSTITANKGDKIVLKFVNADGYHDFVLDEFNAKTKQFNSPGEETIEFVVDKVGSFEYYCSVGTHRAMGMKGTLTVK